jgi:hypothetical protein
MMDNRLMKKGQQEIVGFVLIVVLVVVALMVFLVISVRTSGDEVEGVGVSNMLDVVMRMTTDCAVVYEPDYDDFEDLFKSCFKEDDCDNLGRSACDYLNESLGDVVSSMILSDASVDGWSVEFSERDGAGILRWGGGNCTSGVSGAQRSFSGLVVRMRVC